jgi:hypothetical protein
MFYLYTYSLRCLQEYATGSSVHVIGGEIELVLPVPRTEHYSNGRKVKF